MKKQTTLFLLFLIFGHYLSAFAQMPSIRENKDSKYPKNDKSISLIPKDELITSNLKGYYIEQKKVSKAKIKESQDSLKIDAVKTDIKKIKKINNNIQKNKDSLTKYKNAITSINSQSTFRFFPSSNSFKESFFERIYSKKEGSDFSFVNNAGIQLNNEGTLIQTELTSAYLGAFRVSFGTLISNSKEEDEETTTEAVTEEAGETEAFQRLLNSGGNMYLNFEYPLIFKDGKRWTIYVNGYGKGAIEISEFSDDVDTSTGNGSFGGNLYSSLATDNKEFNFFLIANYGLYMGSDAYYDRLQILNHKSFGFGQVTLGVTIMDRLRLSFMTNTFSSESQLRSGKILFGVQILSGLFEAK